MDGLRQEDFEVWEDGARQEILGFAHGADTPLTLGLLLDRSGSQRSQFEGHRAAVLEFLGRTLRASDSLFAVIFQDQVRLLADLSSCPSVVAEALDMLDRLGFAAIHSSLTRLGPPGNEHGASAVYDAVYYSCLKTKPLAGRKALLLFSDGMDNASRHKLDEAIRQAQQADTLVFVFFQVNAFHLPSLERKQNLWFDNNRLAAETGGDLIEGPSAKWKNALDSISLQLRSMYEISYVSNNSGKKAGFRRILIKAKGLKVKAREGYWWHPAPTGG